MTEKEFEITKAVLLEVLQNTQSEKVKLRAAELLLTLQDRLDNIMWNPFSVPGSNRG